MEFKVATFDVFHDLPQCRRILERTALLADAVAQSRPDAVALQEVARAGVCGQLDRIIEASVNQACGAETYRVEYARADGAGEGEYGFEEGIAALTGAKAAYGTGPRILKYRSQFRGEGTFAGQYYRLPDDRIATLTRVNPGVDLYTTHLTDRPETAADGTPIRVEQARELLAWIAAESDSRTPAIVAGDLNDVPESETLEVFRSAGFIDLYGEAGTPPGYTNDRNDIVLESSRASHNQRIDFLLLRPPRDRTCEIVEAQLFLDRPCRIGGGWLWASDHIGVIATLRLGR